MLGEIPAMKRWKRENRSVVRVIPELLKLIATSEHRLKGDIAQIGNQQNCEHLGGRQGNEKQDEVVSKLSGMSEFDCGNLGHQDSMCSE
jgi:hypothetical protein